KEVYLLDLTALVAGTQFRGQFESRMKGLIEEIRKLGNVILVIDEVHNIVGAGDAEGSMNAANILKPALSRGEIQVIGATTFNEYRKYIEKDTALERRFQPVTVAEPSIEDTLKILKGIAHYYETYHGVSIPEGVLRQAVLLSERYITDRFLPDKAIDLIDEACSDLNLKDPTINRRMEVKRDLENVTFERETLMSAEAPEGEELTEEQLDQRYARIAELRSQEMRLQEELTELEKKGVPQVTMENIARVIEMWTKIPASKIKEEEFKRLAELDMRLKQHIVGQDEAVDAVSAAIRRSRVGISPKHKPVSFIFVGSTGVGKTELVKQLADDLFNSPDSLIRLDMSEFMEKHSVSRLVGSPPGYVGYDEAGQLTEKIRRKPYSVVLFDEIEKAHPDVLNILLQILDDGEVTDAHGRKVNFENTVIVMTSNAGSGKAAGAVGFGRSADDQDKERVMKALQEFLRPEFINRVDEIVYFHQLTEENFRGIAGIMLEELKTALEEKGYHFTYDDALVDYLVKKSYSAAYGARNLRRCIQKDVEDPMAARIIESYETPITQIKATAEDGAVKLYTL
ncbi:MAG: ATP-dependent Clp protease ATP-binding subunit, partial [Oscillospiraceae bacterium]|nr:ATP-dependent Clp protease ATP-binding subunit [Oscillospiraceae bacterium]